MNSDRWHPQGLVPRVVLSGDTNIFQGKCAGQLWITTQSSIDVEISAKVKTYVFPDSSTFTNACASISCFADQFHAEFTMTGKAPLLHQIICPTLHLSTRTAYGVGSIYNDLQIATAAETSFSASRCDTDGVNAPVRAPSDNTLTNSQRSLGIAVHHLSAVTSICPLVACAPLRHIWFGTYGQRVCLQVLRPSSSSSLIVEAQFLTFSLPPKDEAKLLTWDSKFIWLRSMSTRKPIRLPPRRKRFSIQSLALRSCSQDVSSIAFAPV